MEKDLRMGVKKEDWISVSQLSEMTGIRMQHVSRTKKELVAMKLVTKSGNKIKFNKNYDEWVTKSGIEVTKIGNRVTKYR